MGMPTFDSLPLSNNNPASANILRTHPHAFSSKAIYASMRVCVTHKDIGSIWIYPARHFMVRLSRILNPYFSLTLSFLHATISPLLSTSLMVFVPTGFASIVSPIH